MDWIYVTFKDGRLYEDDGTLFSPTGMIFCTWQAAENWLLANDIRATIR